MSITYVSDCPRCGKVHTCEPADVEQFTKDTANEIAMHVDSEALKKLYDLTVSGMKQQYYAREDADTQRNL